MSDEQTVTAVSDEERVRRLREAIEAAGEGITPDQLVAVVSDALDELKLPDLPETEAERQAFLSELQRWAAMRSSAEVVTVFEEVLQTIGAQSLPKEPSPQRGYAPPPEYVPLGEGIFGGDLPPGHDLERELSIAEAVAGVASTPSFSDRVRYVGGGQVPRDPKDPYFFDAAKLADDPGRPTGIGPQSESQQIVNVVLYGGRDVSVNHQCSALEAIGILTLGIDALKQDFEPPPLPQPEDIESFRQGVLK